MRTGPLDWTRVDSFDSTMNDKVSSVKMAGPLLRVFSAEGEALDTGVNRFNLPVGSKVQAIKGDWTCSGN